MLRAAQGRLKDATIRPVCQVLATLLTEGWVLGAFGHGFGQEPSTFTTHKIRI
jgi:hypothetical protein